MIRLQKRTRYALCAAMSMALAAGEHPVTAAGVAARYSIPASVLAKVFQQMVQAGIAIGTRGLGGGYRLARSPSRITVLDIVEAFESAREPAPSGFEEPGLTRLFDEVDEQVRCTFASITLETLVRRPRPDLRLRATGV